MSAEWIKGVQKSNQHIILMQIYRDKLPIVADVMKQPAFPTASWHLEPTSSGLLPVAHGRGGPLKISWEIHGSGPVKLVVRCLYLTFMFLTTGCTVPQASR